MRKRLCVAGQAGTAQVRLLALTKRLCVAGQALLLRAVGSRSLQLFLVGGLIFVLFFYWRYANIPGEFYQARDDGVITMSHAKNLVDYGFIGVNPSGDRVEGFSAPVQFWAYAAAYALTGIGYGAYAAAQTALCAFLLGAVFILFFKDNRLWAIAATALAALLLSYHYSFMGWHGSGMENAITHVLFLAAVLVLFSFARSGRIAYPWALVIFLAAISRIDSIYYIAPLLAVFSAWWFFNFKELKFGGVYFSLAVLGLWLAYNLWRYVYFGDLLPNTAYAQGIEAGGWLERLAESGWEAVAQPTEIYRRIFAQHGGYMLLAALPLLYFTRRDRTVLLLFLLIACIVITACFSPFFFGEARLDASRTTTHMAVFAALGIGLILYHIENRKLLLAISPALIAAGVVVINISGVESRYLCCDARTFDTLRKELASLAEQESLPRPTLANPDLGVMSWHKQFNIVDLGWLGTPVMAKLRDTPPQADYFLNYSAPDFIESRSSWSCKYHKSIFSDSRFEKLYRPVRADVNEWTRKNCETAPESLSGIWIRKDILRGSPSRERELIDRLAGGVSVDALRQELERCQSTPGGNCVYVARTAYRFLPEFREAGLVDELNEVFSASRTRDYDLYLVNGYRDGQAHNGAIAAMANDYMGDWGFDEPIIRSNFEVYLKGNNLAYRKSPCRPEDVAARFFLHLIPVDEDDLPEHRKQYGFNNLDFDFNAHGFQSAGECVAVRELPGYDIAKIRTGQYQGETQFWAVEFQPDRQGRSR